MIGLMLAAGGLIGLWSALRGRIRPAVLAPAAGAAAALILVPWLIYPQVDARKTARPFAVLMREHTAASRAAGHEVLGFELANIPKSLAFYSDGVYTRETDDPAVLAAHLQSPQRVWAVVHEPRLDELPAELRSRLVVVERASLSRKPVALLHNGAAAP